MSAQTLRTPGDLLGSGKILWKWLCHNWLFRGVALYSLQLLLMRGASWTQFFLLQFHFILSARLKSIKTGSFWIAGLSVNRSQIRRVGDAASEGRRSAVSCWSELGLEFWTRFFHMGKYLLQRRRASFLWNCFWASSWLKCLDCLKQSTSFCVCRWGSNTDTHTHRSLLVLCRWCKAVQVTSAVKAA